MAHQQRDAEHQVVVEGGVDGAESFFVELQSFLVQQLGDQSETHGDASPSSSFLLITATLDAVTFPPCLTPQQRRIVHHVAAELGLFHTSSGGGSSQRSITVSVNLPDNYNIQYEPLEQSSLVEKKPLKYAYFALEEEELQRRRKHVIDHALGWASFQQRTPTTPVSTAVLPVMLSSHGDILENRDNCYEIVLDHFVNMLRLFRYTTNGTEFFSLHQSPSIHSPPGVVKFCWVDTIEDLKTMSCYLGSCRAFALDMEMHSERSFFGHTCLLQISTSALYSGYSPPPPSHSNDYLDYDFVVDVLALWEHIGETLKDVMADPTILKVVHGARGGDIPALFRDFGIILVSIFDTQEACNILKERKEGWWGGKIGLGSVLTRLNASIDITLSNQLTSAGEVGPQFDEVKKRLATADWRAR